jgi:20S proteasome subunit alpha 6
MVGQFLVLEDLFIMDSYAVSNPVASLEDLIRHGLHALRETLQQDKELNVNNTSIGLIGPRSEHEKKVAQPAGAFRILENDDVDPFLKTMVAKGSEGTAAPAARSGGATAGGSGDVQMSG